MIRKMIYGICLITKLAQFFNENENRTCAYTYLYQFITFEKNPFICLYSCNSILYTFFFKYSILKTFVIKQLLMKRNNACILMIINENYNNIVMMI